MNYDPTLFLGTAPYYLAGRPAYSAQLESTLVSTLGLDGSGQLLDVGCGPGSLTVPLAPHFAQSIGIDPDSGMLAEATKHAERAGITSIRWIQARAEDLPELQIDACRLVTFGQSFHWTDRQRVAEIVYDLLEPGGALALIVHNPDECQIPEGPGHPRIPHDAIKALIAAYLGPRRRAGQGFAPEHSERFADLLAKTRFGRPTSIFCPGRPDLVQDVDGVMANYFSTSFTALHLFGERLSAFQAEFRALLHAHSPSGLFWDWPGDTEIILARKP